MNFSKSAPFFFQTKERRRRERDFELYWIASHTAPQLMNTWWVDFHWLNTTLLWRWLSKAGREQHDDDDDKKEETSVLVRSTRSNEWKFIRIESLCIWPSECRVIGFKCLELCSDDRHDDDSWLHNTRCYEDGARMLSQFIYSNEILMRFKCSC